MTRAERLSDQADKWAAIYKRTRAYHDLERTKELRAAALKAGASRNCKRRLRSMRRLAG